MTATPWGFRDILPEEAQAREEIALTVKGCFREHHYLPVETPLLEDKARSRRAVALRTRRLSSLMTTVACWWSVPTTRCRSCAWFRPACARPICRCAFATRRRWFASACAMPAARVSLRSWVLSLSVWAIPRAMSRSSRWWRRPCASWHFPVRALSRAACVRLRNCSRPVRIANWLPRHCVVCTPTTSWPRCPRGEKAPSPRPLRSPLASCRACTVVAEVLDRVDALLAAAGVVAALTRELRAWSRAWLPRTPGAVLRLLHHELV